MALALELQDVHEPPTFLRRHAALVAAELRRSAPPPTSRIGAMAAYHMGWADADGRPCDAGTGKMLRASLALWAATAAGGAARDALPAAVAVEWVHNFTLIHDDIQDGDRERRHRPTLWTVVGDAQAINAGDALHAIAQGVLTRPGPRPARRLRAARALHRAVLEVIEGQCLDLALEGRPPARPTASLRLARTKTGALFGGALEAGALLGGAPVATAARLRTAGREVGAAFQLRDDWLGTWGDPSLTGKSCNADLDRRKQTYALAVAWSRTTAAGRREMRRLIAEPGAGGTPRLREILDAAEAGPRTAEAAARLAETAVRGLDGVHLEGGHRGELEHLAAYAAARSR